MPSIFVFVERDMDGRRTGRTLVAHHRTKTTLVDLEIRGRAEEEFNNRLGSIQESLDEIKARLRNLGFGPKDPELRVSIEEAMGDRGISLTPVFDLVREALVKAGCEVYERSEWQQFTALEEDVFS